MCFFINTRRFIHRMSPYAAQRSESQINTCHELCAVLWLSTLPNKLDPKQLGSQLSYFAHNFAGRNLGQSLLDNSIRANVALPRQHWTI